METQKSSPEAPPRCETESYIGVLTIEAHAQVRDQAPVDGYFFNELKPEGRVAIATLAPGEKVGVTELIHMRSLDPLGRFTDTVAK